MKILNATKDRMGYHYDIEVDEETVRHFDWGLDVPEAQQMREMSLLCQDEVASRSVTLDKLVGATLPPARR